MADTFAPGQYVTVDAYGGPLTGMVLFRSDTLVYARGHAYRVRVVQDSFKRYAPQSTLLVHEAYLTLTASA